MTILSRQMRSLSHAKNFVWIQTPEKQQRGFLIYACLLCCFHEQQRQLLWVMNICFFPYCLCNADNLSISKYLHYMEIWVQFTEHFTHFVLKFSTTFEPLYICTFYSNSPPPPSLFPQGLWVIVIERVEEVLPTSQKNLESHPAKSIPHDVTACFACIPVKSCRFGF